MTTGESRPVRFDEVARALRRVRSDRLAITADGGAYRLGLVMAASASGRRNAAEKVIALLAEHGLELEAARPVDALTSGAMPRVRRRRP